MRNATASVVVDAPRDEVFDVGFASLQREMENVRQHFEAKTIQGEA